MQTELKTEDVYVELPEEVEVRYGRGFQGMKRPCHLVVKAIYGIDRSGHDFSASADAALEVLNWRSLREWDSVPSMYVRKAGGARLTSKDHAMYGKYTPKEFEAESEDQTLRIKI